MKTEGYRKGGPRSIGSWILVLLYVFYLKIFAFALLDPLDLPCVRHSRQVTLDGLGSLST